MDSNCIKETNFKFPGQTKFYKGKVRDVYTLEDELVMVVSDRISAFDHVLPRPIPYKGQVLNQIAAYFLNATKDIVPNWLIANPDPNVSIGKKCEPIRIEMVVRGYLAGHAWRTYNSGKRILCGVEMPDGMLQNDPFPNPIITPTSKADEGHDEDISEEEILISGIVSNEVWDKLKTYTLALYQRGQQMAMKQGLILVDTKYEFGIHKGEIVLMDEIHTPDSSRYFYKDGYEERQKDGKPQRQLSKEFVREWLMENGFQGKEGQTMPSMPEEFVQEVSNRYIHLYELITGQDFIKDNTMKIMERVERNVLTFLQNKNLK
jgi:phosphoribosylaminoimidazole-succinocarboxamide synthase